MILCHWWRKYSIKTGRENTAIVGYSFGGRNSLYIGLTRSDLFGYIGAFSPAPGVLPGDDIFTGHFDGLYQEDELKAKYKDPNLLMLSCGTNDSIVFDTPKYYHEVLTKNKQKHIWYEMPGIDHSNYPVISSPYHNFLTLIFGQLNKRIYGYQYTITKKKTKTTSTATTTTTTSSTTAS